MSSMLDLFYAWHWQIVAVVFSLLVLVVYSFRGFRTSSLRLPPGPSEPPLGHQYVVVV
jgi:hypothetical protein